MGWGGLEISYIFCQKNMRNKNKHQRDIKTCYQIKCMLYASQWSYYRYFPERESVNFSVDSSTVDSFRGIVSVLLFVVCVNNKLLPLCRIFEVVKLFSLKFIDTCISAFYICINISNLISCVWITSIGYVQSSQLSLLSLIFICMCVIAFYICMRMCFLFIGCRNKSVFKTRLSM